MLAHDGRPKNSRQLLRALSIDEISPMEADGGTYPMHLTDHERTTLLADAKKLDAIRDYLNSHPTPDPQESIDVWFRHLLGMRMIMGNFSNSMSLVACLMAKSYLEKTLPMRPFDAALKSQNAPGPDIDAMTLDGDRVVAELKTTVPNRGNRFGANQTKEIKKDLTKLQMIEARYKFFFVTDRTAAEEIGRVFEADLSEIMIICLVDLE